MRRKDQPDTSTNAAACPVNQSRVYGTVVVLISLLSCKVFVRIFKSLLETVDLIPKAEYLLLEFRCIRAHDSEVASVEISVIGI